MQYNREFSKKFDKADQIQKKYIIDPIFNSIFTKTKGKHAIDLGCGTGRYCRMLASSGKRVVGIDKNQNQLNIAIQKEMKEKYGINYFKEDITKLKKYGRFDIALLNFVIIESPRAAIKKIFNHAYYTLKKDGILIIGDKHPFSMNKNTSVGNVILKNKYATYFSNGANATSTALLTNGKALVFKNSYHYSLDFILNNLIESGFCIEYVKESAYKDKAPTNIIIVAKKV